MLERATVPKRLRLLRRSGTTLLRLGLMGVAVTAGGIVLGCTSRDGNDASTTADVDMCLHRFDLEGAEPAGAIAYCATRPIENQIRAERVVVVIQGNRRHARTYYDAAMQAARIARAARTLVIAPRFPTHSDVEDAGEGADPDVLFWSSDGWKQGDLSRRGNHGPKRVSSFDVLDRLVDATAKSAPHLREVVIAGHSAGGQFVNRYAAATLLPDRLARRGILVRFVIANPSSYLYLSRKRPHGPHKLARPSRRERKRCPEYNDYKYGLDNVNKYLRRHGSKRELRRRYLSRQVVYLLGGDDDAPDANQLDRTCPAELQGPDRLDRGRAFFSSLGGVGGSGVYSRHVIEVVPDVAHDVAALFASDAGRRALFGSG